MGCSASRPDILLSRAVEGSASYLSSSRSNPIFADSGAGSSVAPSPSPSVPKSRFLAAPLVHHLPTWEGDTHHLVSLTSSTYGSLILVNRRPSAAGEFDDRDCADRSHSPDSVINTWELMEDLDDEDGEANFNSSKVNPRNPRRSTDKNSSNSGMNLVSPDSISKLADSFVFVEKPHEITEECSSNFHKTSNCNSKPLWKHLSEESLLSKMDPNVASAYEQALSSRQLGSSSPTMNSTRSVGSSPMVVSRFGNVTSGPLHSTPLSNGGSRNPGPEDKIVLYFTSLRGIRKTYDDCCTVRMILKGLRVAVDERDISMDATYRKELKDALGGKAVTLPRVFIKGKHVGGADEIKQMNEDGELARLLDGFPVLKEGFVCDSCGDARFVPCGICNGSRKVFEQEEGKMRRCSDCNENGLIRCRGCCT